MAESNKARILVLANENLGVRCLEILVRNNENIAGVIAHPREFNKKTWYKSVEDYATKNRLNVITPKDVNSDEMVGEIRNLNPDVIFSFHYGKLIKKDLINTPRYGSVNVHTGLLPEYRGWYCSTHAILNNSEYAGATMHYINEGADSGDIIAQKKVRIEEDDNSATLIEKVNNAGIDMFGDNYRKLLQGKISGIKQDESKARYYSNKSIDFVNDRQINWDNENRTIYNRIRAFTFPPLDQYPYTSYNGMMVEVIKASINKANINLADFKPGDILRKETGILNVVTKNGIISLDIVRYNGEIISGIDFLYKHGDMGRFSSEE